MQLKRVDAKIGKLLADVCVEEDRGLRALTTANACPALLPPPEDDASAAPPLE